MADVPGDTSTTSTISVGSTVTGNIETGGDHDWYRVTLVAGTYYTVTLNGSGASPLLDAYLRLRDASGNVLFENDQGGGGNNSRITFTVPTSGTYYIDASAYSDPPNLTGTYDVSLKLWTAPPAGTIDQFADELTSGYWGGSAHHFAVTQGGSISVNLTGLTTDGQNLARAALSVWADVLGVTFNEVTTGGQIVFDDNVEGAFANAIWSDGIITSASVNVSTSWISDYGTGVNSYSYQTYIHEIGHALGLGHAGNYDADAAYPYDALYANDSWPMSVMSYFSKYDNPYYGADSGANTYDLTPMVADVVAMQRMYGVSTTTRAGDTTYGYHSTAINPIFDASENVGALCIVDSGGVDTFDYSLYAGTQLIDLNPEQFSSVLGRTANLVIGRGTVIENAIGGSGNDTIIGNAVGNVLTGGAGADSLTGGAGGDIFKDTKTGLNGDTITDFTTADAIVFTDASPTSFTFSLSGNVLTYTGGSLTLANAPAGTFTASLASGGGVQLTLSAAAVIRDVANDFNGDGRSDILWRDDNGQITDWLGTAAGAFTSNTGNLWTNVPTNWTIVGTGDFNGDGRDDVLWRDGSGQLTNWLGTANGTFDSNTDDLWTNVPTNWSVVAVGDFNGDNRDDILWRDGSGQLTDWLGSATGGFTSNTGNLWTNVPTNWLVAGSGDYNGDGRADILWRDGSGQLTNWLGNANGAFDTNTDDLWTNVPINWTIAGSGDFNGDGREDILWRDQNGQLTDWLGTANGGFTSNTGNLWTNVPTNWQVVSIGDYNGDGRDDILWRDQTGQITNWLGNANGAFDTNTDDLWTNVPTNWHVQPVGGLFA